VKGVRRPRIVFLANGEKLYVRLRYCGILPLILVGDGVPIAYFEDAKEAWAREPWVDVEDLLSWLRKEREQIQRPGARWYCSELIEIYEQKLDEFRKSLAEQTGKAPQGGAEGGGA
jgi:hypothetical protein